MFFTFKHVCYTRFIPKFYQLHEKSSRTPIFTVSKCVFFNPLRMGQFFGLSEGSLYMEKNIYAYMYLDGALWTADKTSYH